MLSKLFLGISLIGAEWVLYLLLLLSVVSIAVILERWMFYKNATRGITELRQKIRQAASSGNWQSASQSLSQSSGAQDLESGLAAALVAQYGQKQSPEILGELAQDAVLRAKIKWEQNLVVLATIGSNAPFIGLFGTVLGIIKAFHDLSQQAAGAQTVTSGISEALVATAVGILVAIPAVVAFNLFQRRVKRALTEAEALKSFLIGKLAG